MLKIKRRFVSSQRDSGQSPGSTINSLLGPHPCSCVYRDTEMKLIDRDRETVEQKKEVQEMKAKMVRLQQQNHDFEREIEELTTQLSISLQARETLYKSKTHQLLVPSASASSSRRKVMTEDEEGDGESADEEEINDIMRDIAED
jgi:hypothetical protein